MGEEIKNNEVKYVRTDFGNIYKFGGSYVRGAYGEVCVKLNDINTGESQGEEWEYHLKIGNIEDLLMVGDVIEIQEVIIDKSIAIIGIYDEEFLEEIKKDIKAGQILLLRLLGKNIFDEESYRINNNVE